jgi:hypothetical protein
MIRWQRRYLLFRQLHNLSNQLYLLGIGGWLRLLLLLLLLL